MVSENTFLFFFIFFKNFLKILEKKHQSSQVCLREAGAKLQIFTSGTLKTWYRTLGTIHF